MKKLIFLVVTVLLSVTTSNVTFGHCEVPCGIYHDELRVEMIKEHIQTIEKSMQMIASLQAAETIDYNQLVRWINTKEEHANYIQEITKQYFLTQRVKIADPSDAENYKKYITELSSLHQLLVFSMKSKQGIDEDNIEKMRGALSTFEEAYFGEHRHMNGKEHK